MTVSYRVTATATHNDEATTKTKERSIFVLQLHDGKIVVGSAMNPAKRIAAINSGHCPGIPKALQVNRVVGIKPMNEERKPVSVFRHFETKHGVGNVIAV